MVLQGEMAFCKFLSANDTGETGGHQAGIYISKPSVPILFENAGLKGENKEKWVKFHWQDGSITDTRFIYYGKGTRNEYRITNFGRGFPFLRPEYTGALFVMIKVTTEEYWGYFLNTEEEIQYFLDSFGMSPTQTNKLLEKERLKPQLREEQEITRFVKSLDSEFPTSVEMSREARLLSSIRSSEKKLDPDQELLNWIDSEYALFRELERRSYGELISKGFKNVDEFVSLANQVLNRRKSRAGKSLEHHLSVIFDQNKLLYTAQAITEGKKRPDFLFPSQEAYHNQAYNVDCMLTLAAKTTCKDRWRQVLNEADRLRDKNKYLCTLQQGISSNQMDEMESEKVILVVPKPYIHTYPKVKQDRIWTLSKFIKYVREIETN